MEQGNEGPSENRPAVRIAQFSDCYLPRINGVCTSIQQLQQGLTEAGHEVRLYVPNYPGTPPDPSIVRLTSFYIPIQPEDRCAIPWPWDNFQPDVIHVHTPFSVGMLGWAVARRRKIPLVFTHHTLWEEYAHYLKVMPLSWAQKVGKGICNFFFTRSDAIVMPSHQIAEQLVGTRVQKPHRVIPTGISLDDFSGGQPPEADPYFLYIGRMGKEKSVDALLRAYADYCQRGGGRNFWLVGGGLELESLKKLAGELGLGERVRFTGYQPRENLKNYLAGACLFLFASQTETQGLVLIEAAAAEVPVLAVRASGVNEAVEHNRAGWLVDGHEQLAQALWEMDEPTLERLRANCRAWAERFSVQEMARQMVELYQALGGRK